MSPDVRVVLVDDQELVRRGLRMVLSRQPGIAVVGEAGDGQAALDLLDHVDADVAVVDVRMPGMDGVECTRRLRERAGAPRVLVLTTFDLDEHVFDALRAGASGFLLKDASTEELAAAVRHVHAGDAVVAPSTTARLLDHVTRFQALVRAPSGGLDRFAALTDRELQVVRLVARGLSNAEVAQVLGIAEGTVKVHVGRVLEKLGLRDRVQVVVLAHESGLLAASPPGG